LKESEAKDMIVQYIGFCVTRHVACTCKMVVKKGESNYRGILRLDMPTVPLFQKNLYENDKPINSRR
jgi:hypothetical protein